MELEKILEQIKIAPNKDLLWELAFSYYEIGQQLADVKNQMTLMKGDLKTAEIEQDKKIRQESEKKPTEKEIDNLVRSSTKFQRDIYLDLEAKKESLVAKYEWLRLIFEATKTRIILENKNLID